MTHRSIIPPHSIAWEDCRVVRYSNNGIVLMWKKPNGFDEVLFFIDGEDVGVTKDDLSDLPAQRATPILRALLETHNAVVGPAYQKGYEAAKTEIRKALGV